MAQRILYVYNQVGSQVGKTLKYFSTEDFGEEEITDQEFALFAFGIVSEEIEILKAADAKMRIDRGVWSYAYRTLQSSIAQISGKEVEVTTVAIYLETAPAAL